MKLYEAQPLFGRNDATACNYNPEHDGSTYPAIYDCHSTTLTAMAFEISGCAVQSACNYDATVTIRTSRFVFTQVMCATTGIQKRTKTNTTQLPLRGSRAFNFSDGSCSFAILATTVMPARRTTRLNARSVRLLVASCEWVGQHVERRYNDACAWRLHPRTPADPSDGDHPSTTQRCSSNACNYNPEAVESDGSCYFPGDPCDDGDASTSNDAYNDTWKRSQA